MRAVVQRVKAGGVEVEGELLGSIGVGLVVLLGVGADDREEDAKYLAEKIVNLRIFEDTDSKFNLSALDVGADILVVSQFTLYGDCRKGRRPSFTEAASPGLAERLYLKFLDYIKGYGLRVEQGKFQARMVVKIENDGPVTLLLDSRRVF